MSQELFEAIGEGNLEAVRRLVEADPALAGARDGRGVSAVRMARYRMRDDLVEILLAAGPELDLFDAAVLGRVERVAAILDRDPGAVRADSGDGGTALHLAAFLGGAAMVRLLLQRGSDPLAVAPGFNGVQPIHSAVAGRDGGAVRALLEHGCDVNARQKGGYTPLQGAAHAGMDAVVDLLLAHGADPGARTDDGHTAADLARQAGHGALADRLERS